jgi:hypothetical protein
MHTIPYTKTMTQEDTMNKTIKIYYREVYTTPDTKVYVPCLENGTPTTLPTALGPVGKYDTIEHLKQHIDAMGYEFSGEFEPTSGPMTIKQLRDSLIGLPDDAIVLLDYNGTFYDIGQPVDLHEVTAGEWEVAVKDRVFIMRSHEDAVYEGYIPHTNWKDED